MAYNELIIERESDSDEKGLFLSLPVSYLHTFIDENNNVNLSISGTGIGGLITPVFNVTYNRDNYVFLTNGVNSTGEKVVTLFSEGFNQQLGNLVCGLTLVVDNYNDMLHFYDTYYYLHANIDKADLRKFRFVPFRLKTVRGNICEEDINKIKDESHFQITVDPYTNLITEVISPSDCCFTTYKKIVINNADERLLNLPSSIKSATELVGNYYYIDGNFVPIRSLDENETNLAKIIDVKKHISIIRDLQTNINKTAIWARLFEDYEQLEIIQNDKKEKEYIISNMTNQIFQQQTDIYMARRELCIKEIEELENTHSYKYNTSVCLLIKDENEFLEEWLDNYYDIGVEHFYIYDNKSKVPIAETIANIKNGFYVDKCDVILFTEYEHMQYDCYEDCLIKFGNESKWIGFFDTDEFVEFTDDTKDVNEFLSGFENQCTVWIPWQIYNANGNIEKPKGGMRENYPTPSIDPFGLWGKIFVQTSKVEKVFVHGANSLYSYYPTVEQTGYPLNSVYGELLDMAINGENIYPRVKINHYVTRSYQDWVNKMSRGTCDPNFQRKFDIFFKYNPDLIGLKNDPRVNKLLGSKQGYY